MKKTVCTTTKQVNAFAVDISVYKELWGYRFLIDGAYGHGRQVRKGASDH